MEQQMNNVGGQVTGSAQTMPGQAAHVPSQPPTAGTAPAAVPTDFYTHVQHPATPTQDQERANNPATSGIPGPHQNNNNVTPTTSSIPAEDSDLIEKEWVEKAKTIVEKTRRDPFMQSQELNRLKTEYLQKRYGKNVGSGGE